MTALGSERVCERLVQAEVGVGGGGGGVEDEEVGVQGRGGGCGGSGGEKVRRWVQW